MTRKGFACHSPPLRLPWWGSALLAIFFYVGLKYGAPELHLTNPTLQQLAQAAPTFAPILAIPWLLLAGKQLYDKDIPEEEKKTIPAKDQERPEE
ncbi:MAG: hypothetical protein KJ630_20745 [Proteobacteria bacterium]|nr:hypothetical protein [Pseudomonadota bacterium]